MENEAAVEGDYHTDRFSVHGLISWGEDRPNLKPSPTHYSVVVGNHSNHSSMHGLYERSSPESYGVGRVG